MLYSILIFLFVLVCLMLVGIILLQSSKTGGMGAGVSGQAMNEAFGGDGADKLLVRMTAVLAFSFMFLAGTIAWMDNPNSKSTNIEKPIIATKKTQENSPASTVETILSKEQAEENNTE